MLTTQFIANTLLRRQLDNAQRAAEVLGRGAARSEDFDPMDVHSHRQLRRRTADLKQQSGYRSTRKRRGS